MLRSLVRLSAGAGLLAGGVALAHDGAAHDGVVHKSAAEAAAHAAATAPALPADLGPVTPFPLDIQASFDLIDQSGAARTLDDYSGKPMLIFFGYAACEAICSVALPRMAAALDILGDDGSALQPILITVDPINDTPKTMRESLPRIHPRMIGLTGTEEKLAQARDAFQVEAEKIGDLPDGTPIYAHGSFIYLLDGSGKVLTVLPPILGENRMAEVIRKYI